jgi:prepilin-type N-terminal cleavage/methylation domain-containing protein
MTRLRSERGMTLPEVLVTITIALVISIATFTLVDVTMRRSGEITARVDGVQRGRVAMDTVTRQLRSQICLGSAPARAVTAGTATSMTFYAYMGDPSTKASQVSATATPTPIIAERRSLTLEGTRLIERRWIGTPAPAVAVGFTFTTLPSMTRDLLAPVELVTPTIAGETPALFRYYALDPATSEPNRQLFPSATGLTDQQLREIVRIQVRYRALPSVKRGDGRAASEFINDVSSRSVDPNDPDKLIPCQ